MKIFNLSGHNYKAPEKFGMGVSIKIREVQKRIFLKHYPDGILPGVDEDSTETHFQIWLQAHIGDYEVQSLTLNAALTPLNDAPEFKDIFDEVSLEEVQPAIDFLEQIVIADRNGGSKKSMPPSKTIKRSKKVR